MNSRSASASMLTPVVDLLCVGGLSLLVFVPMLLSGRTDLLLIGAGAQAWLGAAINMPHFMASYRIIYRSKAMILRHPWASIYIPLLLVLFAGVTLWEAGQPGGGALAVIYVGIGSAYLAWHYTGQVWGMMVSYSLLDGVRFEPRERTLVRTSLRMLLAWHLAWFFYTQLRDPTRVRPVYAIATFGTLVAFALGAHGLWLMYRRTGKRPPLRALVAWLALFVWYAVMARDPKAIFWVQIAHALQYLAFPVRVEVNRTVAAHGRTALHMAAYGAALLLVSVVITRIVPGQAMGIVGRIYGEEPGRVAPILLLMFINIHHYFTDGVIWKIGDPEVRKDLFAHATPTKDSAPAAAPTKRPRVVRPA